MEQIAREKARAVTSVCFDKTGTATSVTRATTLLPKVEFSRERERVLVGFGCE